jgi:hypothetical protein
MFVGMILASVAFGWWVQRSREWIRQRQELLAGSDSLHGRAIVMGRHATAPGLLWVFGEEGVDQMYVTDFSIKAEAVEELFPEASVVMRNPAQR